MPNALKAAALALLGGSGADWSEGATARDAVGNPCAPLSPNAVSWDIMGALIAANEGNSNYTNYNLVYKHLQGNIPSEFKNRDIESYNDSGLAWGDVSMIFDGVIE